MNGKWGNMVRILFNFNPETDDVISFTSLVSCDDSAFETAFDLSPRGDIRELFELIDF